MNVGNLGGLATVRAMLLDLATGQHEKMHTQHAKQLLTRWQVGMPSPAVSDAPAGYHQLVHHNHGKG